MLAWSPRVLAILFALFVSLFALDVFDGRHGFWPTLAALLVHLVPTYVIVLAIVLAWRREWIGAVMFAVIGSFFLVIVRPTWFVKAVFAAPCFLTATLYLLNWRKHSAMHRG